jgi:hypothetical protein
MRLTNRRLLAVTAAAGTCTVVLRKAFADRHGRGDRRQVVTVNRPPGEVRPGGGPPPPLDRYGDGLEFTTRPAPGGRGTELVVRLKARPSPLRTSLPGRLSGTDPRQDVRRALREAKSLLETGEVLRADTPPTVRPTLGGRIVGLLSRRSGGEGVL